MKQVMKGNSQFHLDVTNKCKLSAAEKMHVSELEPSGYLEVKWGISAQLHIFFARKNISTCPH